ncbi:MAG: DUF177 domain-containing protein [Candidatus Hydrogenedentota bacterium]
MNTLKIPLASIGEDGYRVDAAVPADVLESTGDGGPQIEGVRLVGEIVQIDSEYLFRGRVRGSFRTTCDRCIVEIAVPFDVEAVWYFEPGVPSVEREEVGLDPDSDADEDGGGRWTFAGGELDLTGAVREEVSLSIPAKFLCREDCKGLCVACGANLNEGPCACNERGHAGSSKLAALADLFPDLRPTED